MKIDTISIASCSPVDKKTQQQQQQQQQQHKLIRLQRSSSRTESSDDCDRTRNPTSRCGCHHPSSWKFTTMRQLTHDNDDVNETIIHCRGSSSSSGGSSSSRHGRCCRHWREQQQQQQRQSRLLPLSLENHGNQRRRRQQRFSSTFTNNNCAGSSLLSRFARILSSRVVMTVVFIIVFATTVADAKYDAASGKTEIERHREVNRVNSLSLVDFDTNNSDAAADAMRRVVSAGLEDRLSKLFAAAKTAECRAEIAEHYAQFVNAFANERPLPFQDVTFDNTCPQKAYYDLSSLPAGMHIGHLQNLEYQPARNETDQYLDDPDELKLLYGILAHNDAAAVIRLVEALYEPGHVFVIHVDGKEDSDETYRALTEYADARAHVHVLEPAYRVRIVWGGFSMVNATLQILRYATAADDVSVRRGRRPLEFHKFVHLAGSSYPVAPNAEIRNTVASYPLDANFVYAIMIPTRPSRAAWFYFVECDDALHRIYRLEPLVNRTAGVELYSSSQWFIASRDFAQYLAESKPGTFVYEYLQYVKHVVVADETFFGTVLRHTEYCAKHHNRNFLHLQFDEWESELPAEARDPRKCMMLDPNHCGRSPTVVTMDDVDLLELTDDLFARKFDDSVDDRVKDVIDRWRAKRQAAIVSKTDKPKKRDPLFRVFGEGTRDEAGLHFDGDGLLVVAKETVNDEMPLCLGLGRTGNVLKLVPCFYDWVPETLAENWATGGVVFTETPDTNRWDIGPCTTDGNIARTLSAEMNVTAGNYSVTGPRCMLKQAAGIRAGRCIDTESDGYRPAGKTHVFPCVHRWHQFLSFGGIANKGGVGGPREGDSSGDNNDNDDDTLPPKNSMFSTLPSQVVKQIGKMGYTGHIPHMCLGVFHRGLRDEPRWKEDADLYQDEEDDDDGKEQERYRSLSQNTGDGESDDHADDSVPEEDDDYEDYPHDDDDDDDYVIDEEDDSFPPLSYYINDPVVVTQCNNEGAVIEWLFVPYLVMDDEDEDEDGASSNATAENATTVTSDAITSTTASTSTPVTEPSTTTSSSLPSSSFLEEATETKNDTVKKPRDQACETTTTPNSPSQSPVDGALLSGLDGGGDGSGGGDVPMSETCSPAEELH